MSEDQEKEVEEEQPPEPVWKRTGECKRCGRCCCQIVTTMVWQPELQDYLEWLSLHQNITVRKDPHSSFVEIEFRNRCKMLRFKNDKALCKVYDNRPKVCRDFPLRPSIGRACPGYTFTLIKPT